MKIFDLHCDTIETLKNNNETFDNSNTQFARRNWIKQCSFLQYGCRII